MEHAFLCVFHSAAIKETQKAGSPLKFKLDWRKMASRVVQVIFQSKGNCQYQSADSSSNQ